METLTRWLSLTAVLAASANPDWAGVAVKAASRVKGHPEEELMFSCGEGNEAGAVRFWHTPFGELLGPGFHSPSDPVFLRHDGTLVVPSASGLHSGLYYCLLQAAEGTTLWAYELHVGRDDPQDPERGRNAGSGTSRSRRDAGSGSGARGVSEGHFAAIVVASVLLTFVVGFSAGALSRAQVIRCLGAVTKKLRSGRKQRSQTRTTPDRRYVVATTTLEAVHVNEAFKMEHVWDKTSVQPRALNTTMSSTAPPPPPPAKPKRSFRVKEREEQDSAIHVEACDHEEEERTIEEEEEETQLNSEEEEEEEDDRGSREERRQEGHVETRSREGEEGSEEETGSEEEEQREEEEEGEGEGKPESSSDEETKTTKNNKDGGRSATSRPGRRIIRLYQYDDEGQLYSHLPDPAPSEPGPAPKLKPRAVSLSRLNAIMAAASAGPMDMRETESEDGANRFHMEM